MATSSIKKGTDPAGTAVATHSFTEDAETRHVQRIALADAAAQDVPASATGGVPVSVSVAATANGTQVLAALSTRVGWIFHNASDVDIYYGFSATGVTTANGIRIFPGGSDGQRGPGIYRGVIHAIVTTGTADLRVQ